MPAPAFRIQEVDREHKVCPIMSGYHGAVPCQGPGCQLWTSVYTTDGNLFYGCTYELQARLNMDGRVSA